MSRYEHWEFIDAVQLMLSQDFQMAPDDYERLQLLLQNKQLYVVFAECVAIDFLIRLSQQPLTVSDVLSDVVDLIDAEAHFMALINLNLQPKSEKIAQKFERQLTMTCHYAITSPCYSALLDAALRVIAALPYKCLQNMQLIHYCSSIGYQKVCEQLLKLCVQFPRQFFTVPDKFHVQECGSYRNEQVEVIIGNQFGFTSQFQVQKLHVEQEESRIFGLASSAFSRFCQLSDARLRGIQQFWADNSNLSERKQIAGMFFVQHCTDLAETQLQDAQQMLNQLSNSYDLEHLVDHIFNEQDRPIIVTMEWASLYDKLDVNLNICFLGANATDLVQLVTQHPNSIIVCICKEQTIEILNNNEVDFSDLVFVDSNSSDSFVKSLFTIIKQPIGDFQKSFDLISSNTKDFENPIINAFRAIKYLKYKEYPVYIAIVNSENGKEKLIFTNIEIDDPENSNGSLTLLRTGDKYSIDKKLKISTDSEQITIILNNLVIRTDSALILYENRVNVIINGRKHSILSARLCMSEMRTLTVDE